MESEIDQVRITVIHGSLDLDCPHDSTTNYLKSKLTKLSIRSHNQTGHNLQLSNTGLIASELKSLINATPPAIFGDQ